MTEELKPCPFCGGVAMISKDMIGDYRVECYHCFAHTFYEDSEEKGMKYHSYQGHITKNYKKLSANRAGAYNADQAYPEP